MTQITTRGRRNRIEPSFILILLFYFLCSLAAAESATIRVTGTVIAPFGPCETGKLGNLIAESLDAENLSILLNNSNVICQTSGVDPVLKNFLLNQTAYNMGDGTSQLVPLENLHKDIINCIFPRPIIDRPNNQIVVTFVYSEN